MTNKQYREQVLQHAVSTLEVLAANAEYQSDSSATDALVDFLELLSELMHTMENVKSDEAFTGVVKGLRMVLQKEFFDQVSQSRQSQTKESQPRQEEKPKKPAPKTANDIHKHLKVDPKGLPKPIVEIIAAELKKMGLPEEQVDDFFAGI